MAEQLDTLVDDGMLSTTINTTELATLIISVLDGLQLQWLYEPTIDMATHLRALFDLLGQPVRIDADA